MTRITIELSTDDSSSEAMTNSAISSTTASSELGFYVIRAAAEVDEQ